jgi:hypothetical protein
VIVAWSDALTTGTFTLLGVAVGIVLGATVEYALERRREGRAFLQARRLIAEELLKCCMDLDHFVSKRVVPKLIGSGDTAVFPNASWLEYRAVYAAHGSDQEFALLSRVFTGIAMLRDEISTRGPGSAVPPDLVQTAIGQLNLVAFSY